MKKLITLFLCICVLLCGCASSGTSVEDTTGTNSEEYESILKALPDIAPKSFSSYRRMKNGNTAGFQKLLKLVDTVET